MLRNATNSAARTVARTTRLFFPMSLLVLAVAFLNSSRPATTLESVLAEGELHIVSRNGPTTYYEGSNGLRGFEYKLAKRFADQLGVALVIHDEEDLGKMIDSVQTQQFHFAAAGLTVTDKRNQKVKFSTPYLNVKQQLIYRQGATKPKTMADVVGGKIVVIGNSSHTEYLRHLQREHPQLDWEEKADVEMLDLMEMVHNGDADYTIINSNAYNLSEPVYPRARVAFNLREQAQLAWAFPHDKDDSLYKRAQDFFAQEQTAMVIQDTIETYYGHLGELDYAGAILFSHRLDSRLPKWEQKLRDAAYAHDLDWQLLAALSYQESHWNPKAKSPTGVRGFMMLTLDTAKDMGVKNRVDADQSIAGGAKYFKSIYSRIPERTEDPDRTWLALAAYNIGLGHLEDARILTQHHGGDPDKWVDVSENLLLLSKRQYYKFTKHGYARGWEAVSYVQNIRNFRTIIAWNEKAKVAQQLAQNSAANQNFAQFSPVMTEAVRNVTVSAL